MELPLRSLFVNVTEVLPHSVCVGMVSGSASKQKLHNFHGISMQ